MKPEILAIQSIEGISQLKPEDFFGVTLTEEEITHIFKLCGALWMHSGNPEHPHAELTSGLCSNGFVDCMRALCHTNVSQIMAHQAVRKLRTHYDGAIDWVIGSAYAAITFSKDVANAFGVRHGFTEKDEGKTQLWRRLVIGEDEVVLQVEELMTTTGTTQAVKEGIELGNGLPVKFAPCVLVLVHRSDSYEVDGKPIVYPVHYDIWSAKPEECSLCAQGSKRLRPKTNWKELTAPLKT